MKLKCLAIMYTADFEGKGFKTDNTLLSVKYGGSSIMLFGCCATRESGELHKVASWYENRTSCGNTEAASQDISG